MRRSAVLFLAGAAIASAPILAQDVAARPATPPASRAMSRVCTPIHEAPADAGRPYGIWAAGAGYKASFHDGMTFVPYLGTAYPENLPLSWRTTAVTAGGVALLRPEPRPTGVRSDYRYEYRFAGGVTEAYDVLLEGLEQTFVITRLPAAGDLLIRGAINSPLRAANVAPAHQTLTFRDAAGNPIVEYGAGIAFDSSGRKVEVLTGHESGEITLTVPGDWLASAKLPVVVDPLFGPFGIPQGSSSQLVTAVDMALDGEALLYNNLIVHCRAASASDEDLYVHVYDGSYQNIALAFADLTSSWSTDSPACAYVGGADRYTTVFRRLFANGQSQIRAHVHDRGSTTQSSAVAFLVPPTGWNHWRPDVGGVQSFHTGADALIVFQAEDNTLQNGQFVDTARSQIQGVIFDPSTTNGTFGAPFPIASSPIADNERPTVNRIANGSSSQPYSWICAFQTYGGVFGPDDWDVLARRIDNAGNLASGVFSSDLGASNTEHQLGPIVEGSGGRYAVTFAARPVLQNNPKHSNAYGTSVHLERFDWSDGSAAPTADLPAHELTTARALQATSLAFDSNDRSHWCAVWHEDMLLTKGSGYAYVGYNGVPTEIGYNHPMAPSAQNDPAGAVFDPRGDGFRIASATNQYPSGNEVFVTYGLYWSTPMPTVTGVGCSNANIDWSGTEQIGAEFSGVQVSGTPATAGHFLLVSLASADLPITIPGVGSGCRLLIDQNNGYLGAMGFRTGIRPFWQFPLPEWLTPTSLYFQDWILDNNEFRSTQRLRVQIIK